jgi:hypothetical protein
MPRTGSIASKVGPAVSSTPLAGQQLGLEVGDQFVEDFFRFEHPPEAAFAARLVAAAGPRMATPSPRSVATLRMVAGFSHICRFIAGATSSGQSRASTRVVSRSSASPLASLARKSAEAGATRSRSASRERSMCAMLLATRGSHWSVKTGWPDSA